MNYERSLRNFVRQKYLFCSRAVNGCVLHILCHYTFISISDVYSQSSDSSDDFVQAFKIRLVVMAEPNLVLLRLVATISMHHENFRSKWAIPLRYQSLLHTRIEKNLISVVNKNVRDGSWEVLPQLWRAFIGKVNLSLNEVAHHFFLCTREG